MTADQVSRGEADSDEDEAVVMQLTLPISDGSLYFPLIRPNSTTRPSSTRLERDPLGPSFLRRLEARGSSKKGIAAYRYQLEAVLKIAESIVGESVTLEHIFNDLRLLGKVLISDVAACQSEQLSKWTLAQRRSAARSFARLVQPELRTSLGCDPESCITEALQAVAERVGSGYRLSGGRPRRRGGAVPARSDVSALIAAAKAVPGYRGVRNLVFFEILARTGTRINALRLLDGRDCVLMPSGKLRLFVHDKGKTEPREVELDPVLVERLENYVLAFNQLAAGRRWRTRIGIGIPGPLWKNSQRGAWSYRAIISELHRACDQAGVPRSTPHALRRAFATDAASELPRHIVALAGGWHGLERLDDHYIQPRSSDIWRKFGSTGLDERGDEVVGQDTDVTATSI